MMRKPICPWCEQEIENTYITSDGEAWRIDRSTFWGARLWEYWHRECRLDYMRIIRARGWVRRLIDWIL